MLTFIRNIDATLVDVFARLSRGSRNQGRFVRTALKMLAGVSFLLITFSTTLGNSIAMGAWGYGSFENDTALDWVYHLLEESKGTSLLQGTVEAVFVADYIDADVASEALAAIEILARLAGRINAKTEIESVDTWIANNKLVPSSELLNLSCKALVAIRGEDSELRELFEESDLYEVWLNHIGDLERHMCSGD